MIGKYYIRGEIMKNNKGFTLIELLISLGLISVVVLAVVSFFISYVKANDTVSNMTELQYEARKVVSFMSEKFMSSEGIVWISDELTNQNPDVNNQYDKASKNIDIKLVNLKNKSSDNSKTYCSFKVKNNKLFYGETNAVDDHVSTLNGSDENTDAILAENVKTINIQTNDNEIFRDTDFIKISVTLEKDGDKYFLEQNVYMRNK